MLFDAPVEVESNTRRKEYRMKISKVIPTLTNNGFYDRGRHLIFFLFKIPVRF